MEDNKYFTGEDFRNYFCLMLSVGIMSFALFWIFLLNVGPFGVGVLVLGALIFLKTSRNIFFPHKYKKHMKHYTTAIVVVSLFVLVFMVLALVGIVFQLNIAPSIQPDCSFCCFLALVCYTFCVVSPQVFSFHESLFWLCKRLAIRVSTLWQASRAL